MEYICSEPEFVEDIIRRRVLECIPAESTHKTIGWTVQNYYIGGEIYPYELSITKLSLESPRLENKDAIKLNELKIGSVVALTTFSGWAKAIVESINFDTKSAVAYSENKKYMYPMYCEQDNRKCWCCGSVINTAVMDMKFKIEG